MQSEHVAVDYARSLGGPNGFIGVINKSKEQNDLSMDFMMFYSSPEDSLFVIKNGRIGSGA